MNFSFENQTINYWKRKVLEEESSGPINEAEYILISKEMKT